MTAIVGLVHEGRVWIGGDSAASNSWTIHSRADAKVFRNGHAVFGTSGSIRAAQLVEHALVVPDAIVGDVAKYMCTTFVDSVRECWKAGGAAQKLNEVESGGIFLVGMFGRLFEIQGDYQVAEQIEPWTAIGSGKEVALGSLWSTAHVVGLRDQPGARVRLALQAAANYSIGVRGPFKIIATEAP
jgi:ATP-dependent protease HslVU (ClpYQ) peptidase subunit